MACRAVLAAGEQGAYEEMIVAIQQAYYERAMNPSDLEVLEALSGELSLDVAQFKRDIQSDTIEARLQQEVDMARAWPVSGFPSLVLVVEGKRWPVALDYSDEGQTLAEIERLMGLEESQQVCLS